jgi:hypothetical protein
MHQGNVGVSQRSPIQLQCRFKGARTYVHGTDMFAGAQASLQARFGSDCWVREIRFHRLVTTQCDLVSGIDEASAAVLTVQCNENALERWCIVPRIDPVTERYPYDEDGVVAPSAILGDSISMATRSSATAIEEIVALTKRFHLTKFPSASGRWLFAGLRLLRPLVVEADGPFRMILGRSLGGKLTQSMVEVRGVQIGEIDFALTAEPGPK